MEKELQSFLLNKEYYFFIKQTEFWLKKAISYHRQYNNKEYALIMEIVIRLWNNFRSSSPILSDEEKLDTEILEEDYHIGQFIE